LRYDVVKQIKQDFPELTIIVNGGIKSCDEIAEQLKFVDGVMVGREAYANPFLLAEIEKRFFSSADIDMTARHAIIEKFIPYVELQLAKKVRLTSITRHILGLFQGQVGARSWRRYISEHAHQSGAGIEILTEALKYVRYTQCTF
jgi:tRNA-dihydrouridine synthase A